LAILENVNKTIQELKEQSAEQQSQSQSESLATNNKLTDLTAQTNKYQSIIHKLQSINATYQFQTVNQPSTSFGKE